MRVISELTRAVWAAACGRVDFHLAERTFLCRGWRRRGFLDELGHSPDDERDDDEIDQDADEIADSEFHRADIPGRGCPVASRRHGTDDRHDEVIDDGRHDLADGGAEHDGYREGNKIVLHQKALEVPQHQSPLEKDGEEILGSVRNGKATAVKYLSCGAGFFCGAKCCLAGY